eukprot:176019-Amphidinium_carterae.1
MAATSEATLEQPLVQAEVVDATSTPQEAGTDISPQQALPSSCPRCNAKFAYFCGFEGFGWRRRTHEARCF